jgi:cell wall-associated NlpC family hydrolase
MHAKANDIIQAAKELVGVPYKHQGRNRVGLDCAGLVIVVARSLGIIDMDTTAYSRRPNVQEFTKAMLRAGCRQLPFGEHRHGDILRFNSSGWPVHIGYYEIDEKGAEWYIHAYLPHRKVTRDPLTPKVKATISSVWRLPE